MDDWLKRLSVDEMNQYSSRQQETVKRNGYKPMPVISFWGREYVILDRVFPHPGRNTIEVIDIALQDSQDFSSTEGEKLLVTTGRAGGEVIGHGWVMVGETGVFALTATPDGVIGDTEVTTSVLTYIVAPPSSTDLTETHMEMGDELIAQE